MSKIIHKKSSVLGKVPLPNDLEFGELAINYADGYLYYKSSNGTVQSIKTASSADVWQVVSSNYLSSSGDKLLTNTSAGSFSITLPATPVAGMNVVIADSANWAINPVILEKNGSLIQGLPENLSLDIKGAEVTVVYDGTSWQVFSSTVVDTGGSVVDPGYGWFLA